MPKTAFLKACFLSGFLLSGLVVFSQVKEIKPPVNDTVIVEEIKDAASDNLPVITIDEGESDDAGAQNVSSQLTAGRDPFVNAANFKFGVVRFRIRGYDADNFSTYMNGAPMENLDNDPEKSILLALYAWKEEKILSKRNCILSTG